MGKTAKILLTFEIITLILLIILSFFVYPQADDFSFANSLHNLGWLGSQINWYKTWFGRFSSTMLMISLSYIDLSVLCKIFPVFIIFGYLFAFYLASKKLFPDVSKKFRAIFALTVFLLYVSGMPSLSQGIYWFCGAATYAVANIVMIIFLSSFGSIKNNKTYIGLILLGVFIAGSNETAMLIFMICVSAALLKDYRNKKLWMMFTVFAVFSLIVVLSPGNALRSEMFVGNHQIFLSVFKSTKTLIFLLAKWLLNPLLWAALFVFNYFKQKLRIKTFAFEIKPVWAMGFALFLMFCSLFPAFWSMNGRPPERTLNTMYLLFLFLVLYIVNLEKVSDFLFKTVEHKKIIFPLLTVWLLVTIHISGWDLPRREDLSFYLKNPANAIHFVAIDVNQNNLFVAYKDLLSGRLFDYKKTMIEREEKIKNYKGGLLCLPKVEKLPGSIVFQDLYEDSEFWINRVFAEYYHVEKVTVCNGE